MATNRRPVERRRTQPEHHHHKSILTILSALSGGLMLTSTLRGLLDNSTLGIVLAVAIPAVALAASVSSYVRDEEK